MTKYLNYLTFFIVLFWGITLSCSNAIGFPLPERSVSIIATAEGFYPQKLAVFTGERVHLFLTATTDKSSCFIMDGKQVFLGVEKGKVSEFDLYFDRPGEFRFYCPKGKLEGTVIVLEAPTKSLKKELKREIASKQKAGVRVWMPSRE